MFRRDKDKKKVIDAITTFKPYCYIHKDYFNVDNHSKFIADFELNHKSIFGDDVVKVFFDNNKYMRYVTESLPHEAVFESDISHDLKYLIDEVDDFESSDYRLLTFDIETDTHLGFPDKDNPVEPIISISTHDSYTEDEKLFIWRSDQTDKVEVIDGVERLYFSDERLMLKAFINYWRHCSFDIVTAWNINFDMGYLISRLDRLRIDKNQLSPVDIDVYNKVTILPKGECRVFGVVLFDALSAYKKMHFGELNSFALNNVAIEEVGAEKEPVHNTGLTWRENLNDLATYNIQDTRLVVQILNKTKIMSIFEDIKNFAGVRNINDCFYASRIHETRILRKYRDVVLPNKKPFVEKSADTMIGGAFVKEPKAGMYNNVAVFDFKSLYPSLIYTFNLSTEKVCDTGTKVKDIRIDMAEKGIMPSMIKELVQLKDEMKIKVAGTGQSVSDKMFAIKTFINSFYGINALPSFRLYNKSVAETITGLGQEFIKSCNEFVEQKLKFDVVYNDTDSLFVKLPDDMSASEMLKISEVVCRKLNEHVDSILKNYGVKDANMKMEMEKIFSSIILFKKKRYAGIITWEDEPVDKIKMAGVAARRSDSSAFSKSLQKDLLEKVLRGYSADETLIYCKKAVDKIINNNISLTEIAIPIKLNKDINDYPIQNTPKIKAVKYSNENLNTSFKSGDKFLMLYVKSPETDVVAFDDEEQVTTIQIDKQVMCEKVILQKVKSLFEVLSWHYRYDILNNYVLNLSNNQSLLGGWM